jgi:hypothetical protein
MSRKKRTRRAPSAEPAKPAPPSAPAKAGARGPLFIAEEDEITDKFRVPLGGEWGEAKPTQIVLDEELPGAKPPLHALDDDDGGATQIDLRIPGEEKPSGSSS